MLAYQSYRYIHVYSGRTKLPFSASDCHVYVLYDLQTITVSGAEETRGTWSDVVGRPSPCARAETGSVPRPCMILLPSRKGNFRQGRCLLRRRRVDPGVITVGENCSMESSFRFYTNNTPLASNDSVPRCPLTITKHSRWRRMRGKSLG